MDYLLPVQQFETVQHGVGKLANERDTEALEVILFDELIEIHPSKVGGGHLTQLTDGNNTKSPMQPVKHFPP